MGINKTQLTQFFEQELDGIYTRSEAEVLLSLTLETYTKNINIELLKVNIDELPERLVERCKNVLIELKNYRPIQYILNQAHFFGLIFTINEHVLIPRPETEELVFWILEDVKSNENDNLKILDIGTGSGCIAITLKKKAPKLLVSAMDISAKALEVARTNALINRVDVNFMEDDILHPNVNLTYDVIVSNPPYVRRMEMTDMEKNVLDFEPHLALFVEDEDPLLYYRGIVDFALMNLNQDGTLYLEINEFLSKETVSLLEDKLFKNIEVKKDMQGKDRMIKASKA